MLEQADNLDGIVIATRCDLHAPLAVKVARAAVPIFLEKPAAISTDQIRALHHAYSGRGDQVVVSFPLRLTPLLQKVCEIIRSGRLGVINHVQASNFVPYGGVYFGQWYRDHEVTGGLWLQKATHDFDYINQLIAAQPTAVVATSTRKIYGGVMPADLVCSKCQITAHCPESPTAIAQRDDDGGMGRDDHACAFSASIQHHDAGSALVMYSDGTHAAYTQNFVSRRSAQVRGARVTGYLATLIFDFYSEQIQLIEHHGKAVETIDVKVTDGHHGGDAALVRNFVDVIRGVDHSRSNLHDGLLSAAMCIAARTSESTRRVEPVVMPADQAVSVTIHPALLARATSA
jgi:predicted dehydrogenase